MKKSEVIITDENNSYNYIIITKRLLSSLMTTTGFYSPRQMHGLLSKMRITSFGKKSLLSVAYFFMAEGAATRQIIIKELGIVEPTVYRAVKFLEEIGFVKPIAKAYYSSKGGGQRSVVYAVPDCDDDAIIKAMEKEKKRIIPYFTFSDKVKNLVLDEFIYDSKKDMINRNIVLATVKGENRYGFNNADVTDDVCRLLKAEGIKIII